MDFGYTPSLARGTIDAHVQLHELILSFFFKKKKKKRFWQYKIWKTMNLVK